MTESILISWAVARLCIQQCNVHPTFSPRSSIVTSGITKRYVFTCHSSYRLCPSKKKNIRSVLPKWLLSALWYIASWSAFVCNLLKTGSLPSLWPFLPSTVCCWGLVLALPSASISSKDKISFSPRFAEKFNGWDSNWWRQLLWPCAVATDTALW